MLTRLIEAGRRHAAVTVAMATLILGTTAFALAQPGPGGGRGPGGPLGPLFALEVEGLRGLDLTDAQREQVRSILSTHRDEARALAARGRTAMDALRAATRAATDENAIRHQGEALGTVIADAAVLRSRVRTEVWGVLTAEQQAKAEQLRNAREARLHERRQRMEERRQERRQRSQAAGQGAQD